VVTLATITQAPQANSHLGDLDGSHTTNKNRWVAVVDITVHDDQHNPVAGAVVTGSWSTGFVGADTCTTDTSGHCTVTTDEILKKNGSVVYTIENISHNTLVYDQALNHDPDSDSDGTTITVYRDQVSEPTPTPPPTGSLHIGDLDEIGTAVRTKWQAEVIITVHDEADNPLTGVTVTGAWSVGGEANCITDVNGTCSVSKKNLKTSVTSITFQITNAALSSHSYQPGSNHDSDGDSDGTTITVFAP
jgi:hypothetical protein